MSVYNVCWFVFIFKSIEFNVEVFVFVNYVEVDDVIVFCFYIFVIFD